MAARVGHTSRVELLLFDEVADAVTSLVPPDLGEVRCRAHRYGIKVWFGAETPSKEHYEAQVMGAAAMDEAKVLVLEIGFHAEHPDEARNQALLDQLLRDERRWRRVLGSEAEAGPSSADATTGAGCPSCGPTRI